MFDTSLYTRQRDILKNKKLKHKFSAWCVTTFVHYFLVNCLLLALFCSALIVGFSCLSLSFIIRSWNLIGDNYLLASSGIDMLISGVWIAFGVAVASCMCDAYIDRPWE